MGRSGFSRRMRFSTVKSIYLSILLMTLCLIGCTKSDQTDDFECEEGSCAMPQPQPETCGHSYECGTVLVSVDYTGNGEICTDTDDANEIAIYEAVSADYNLEFDGIFSCTLAFLQVPEGQEEYWVEILSEDERLLSAGLSYLLYTTDE